MSSLQISLAIIGGLVLAGVVAYNAWITRKSAPRTARESRRDGAVSTAKNSHQRLGPGAGPDARTATDERIDPLLGEAVVPGQPVEPLAAAHGEPVLAEPIGRSDPVGVDASGADSGADMAQAPVVAETLRPPVQVTLQQMVQVPEKRAVLDALIDVIAPMPLDSPVSGEALLAAMPATRRVGSKPFAIEGVREDSDDWEMPRPGQRYRALQAGVQLANRSGALNDIEFSEFVVKTQAYADAVGAMPDFPDMRAEVARARELDAFASAHDAQLGFTLRARRVAWSPGYVAQQASQWGFVPGALPGRMVVPGSQGGQAPVLSLSFDPQAAMADDPEQSALRELSLLLEVTHVPRSEQAFQRLRQAAAALAQAMDGVVTDDAGQALTEEAMDRIGADLETLYDALDSRDLSAGSPQARRLFS
ncbi:MAG TPA: cell division protein ZipA C-terminal FtsZ-binding domain-containing protein [Hydrogenophaga sp.]|uniref:cell division protein ZipA C-terminal FtsZ-binding domain-containing protein n=1 Tax=Hydrogenophaga sp. TaxID=1904254 RepID=UPI002C86B3A7|nr:cell division protein ZipA C-terminal FtsZ-binding domain-containing protein [Hydrogenophaga sp.]HMN92388.1 cell division protein ZipA C-terminal FtsZ-binding domain-containing protein [Hydrogenophaga sp.]HMP10614.1 cell division protein ZipA C-terminal FtsZ-binding domain-containing protein [Hydrogenophaga sp.]